MGLDMYLYKKHYVKNWDHDPERKTSVSVKLNGKKHPAVNPKNVTYIQEEAGYWRKANQIHQWFVDHVQNGVDECQESYVEISQLESLLQLCITIRDSDDPKTTGEELLPTQGGFFFGGTEYDEYYIVEIKDTIKILETELKKVKELEVDNRFHIPEYYYRASW